MSKSKKNHKNNPSRTIPNKLKQSLIEEAGNKCANPGCSNYLTEIHHIKEWAIHKSHDQAHMIAICPACHDSVSRGTLKIDDETLYSWKKILRNGPIQDHIYVEPGNFVRLLLGSLTVETSNNELVIFVMPNDNRLSFEIINGKFPLIDLTIKSLNGDTIISLEKNYISSEISTDIKPKRRPGKFQLVLTNQALSLIPSWIKRQHMLHDTDFFATQEHTLFDIEVVEPGLVKINGIWMYKDTALVISPNGMSVIRRGNEAPITFKGEGSKSILRYRGPISLPLFGLFP